MPCPMRFARPGASPRSVASTNFRHRAPALKPSCLARCAPVDAGIDDGDGNVPEPSRPLACSVCRVEVLPNVVRVARGLARAVGILAV